MVSQSEIISVYSDYIFNNMYRIWANKGHTPRRLTAGDRLSLGVGKLPIFPFLTFALSPFITQKWLKCKGEVTII